MAKNKILKTVTNINKPISKNLRKYGWELRVKNRKRKGDNFRELSSDEKNEIKNFWKKYNRKVSPDWTSYYSYANNIKSEKYIPDSLFYSEIIPKLNQPELAPGLADKNMYDSIFSTNMPKTIIRKINNNLLDKDFNPITFEDAFERCNNEEEIIIKPSNGSYGSGIEFWTPSKTQQELKQYLNNYDDLIVQEVIKQHSFFENIHPSSLNTVRVMTFLSNNKFYNICSILRMGQNNSRVDNYSAGGIICSIDKNGKLYKRGIQADQSIITQHPDGFVFEDQEIPYYDEIINQAEKMHYRIPFFKLISWDFAIDQNGKVIFIEGNYPGSQIDLHQLNIGPVFGEYTDIILSEVYHN